MAVEILIIQILILLFSVVLHEVSHGVMANYFGDPTAKMAGRLSLNPLKHLSFLGSVLVPLMLIIMRVGIVFGWAKPVPINPYNLKGKHAEAKVAAAGPLANMLVALVFGLILRFVPLYNSVFWGNIASIFIFIVWINLILAVFNLIPIYPLDGSHILFALFPSEELKIFFSRYGILILIFFIFFLFRFLIPIIVFLFELITGISSLTL